MPQQPEIPEHLRAALGGPADSAGVPWGGRELHPNPFAGDTGEADAGLLAALSAVAAAPLEPLPHRAVLRALAGARLYAPVLPVVTESEVDARGLMHDNASDMAMVRLKSADGREATPAFTSIPALTSWHGEARPVPIEAERLGAAAVEEGAALVVVDPGQPHSFLLRRPALWSFLAQEEWKPAWADAEVADALRSLTSGCPWLRGVGMGPGSRSVHTQGPEVRIELRVDAQPAPEQLQELQRRLADHELLAERIDSLALALVPA